MRAVTPVNCTGRTMGSEWSHDGKYLAYITSPSPSEDPVTLCIQSFDTGAVTVLHPQPKLGPFGNPRWSRDDHFIVAEGVANMDDLSYGYYKVDIQTGASQEIIKPASGIIPTYIDSSRDGSQIYYAKSKINEMKNNIEKTDLIVFDLNIGKETILYSGPHLDPTVLAMSPDADTIIVGINDSVNRGSTILQIIPVTGAIAKDFLKFDRFNPVLGVEWSPYGHDLYYVRGQQLRSDIIYSLWRVSTQGGTPREIFETEKTLERLRIHPDGQHLAFTDSGFGIELWSMENFLPEE